PIWKFDAPISSASDTRNAPPVSVVIISEAIPSRTTSLRPRSTSSSERSTFGVKFIFPCCRERRERNTGCMTETGGAGRYAEYGQRCSRRGLAKHERACWKNGITRAGVFGYGNTTHARRLRRSTDVRQNAAVPSFMVKQVPNGDAM